MEQRIVSICGEIYLDILVGPDCDGGTEVREIESMTFLIKSKGGSISGDLLQYKNVCKQTPADNINMTVLHSVIDRELDKENEEATRTRAEDNQVGFWEERN